MTEKFILGVEHLDNQHRSLFTGIERIRTILDDDHDYERKRRACEEGVHFLVQHGLRHFSDEEAYMRSINDARYVQHKQQHEALLEQLQALRQELAETDYSIPAVKHLLGTLMSWLSFHTNEVDSTIGKELAQVDPINDAAVALEKTVTRVIPDLFSIRPELVDGDYKVQYYGSEIFSLVDFGHSGGQTFRLVTALDEPVVLQVINTLFSSSDTQVDELGLSAIRELMAMLAVHFAQHYREGTIFRIHRTLSLSREELAAELPAGEPLCSLLFHQSTGAVSLRLWQL